MIMNSLILFYPDFTVGRLKKEDISLEYPKECRKLGVERYRRCLNVHPEFSESLSSSDRAMLLKRNLSISGALLACKVNRCNITSRTSIRLNLTSF